MTNLEAIRAKVGYPLSDEAFEIALQGQGFTSDEIYVIDVNADEFELAYADALRIILTSPSSVTEGGFSISISEKKIISDIVDRIYAKHDIASPEAKPTGKFIQPW
jgi:hypothetical protein